MSEQAVEKPRGCIATLFGMMLRFVLTTVVLSAIIGIIGYKSLDLFITGTTVSAPNVCGSDLEAALKKLQPNRLMLELEKEEYHSLVEAGKIIRQAPAPGTSVKSHTPVRVVLSLGSRQHRVPKVVGLKASDAEIALRDNQFDLGRSAWVFHDTVERGLVISQDPPPESLHALESPVHLLISYGPEKQTVEMPNLLSKNLDIGRLELQNLGLRAPLILREDRQGVPRNTIIRQQPPSGHSVNPDSEIQLTVSSGI